MDRDIDAAALAEHIGHPSARGIASAITALVRGGDLAPGVRLPTVRGLATELGVSPATVAQAWSTLRLRRVIATGRRNGTTVLGAPSLPHPTRFERIGNFGNRLNIDLSWAVPDPALLPPLEAALVSALDDPGLHDYAREPITARLRDAVAGSWPFPAESWLAVGGGYEGLHLICQTSIQPGDRVAVEQPTAPRILDILDAVGAELIPVACDVHGPLPDQLQRALRTDPVAFVYQPRTHSPCGHSVAPARLQELADALSPVSALVIEDDGQGDLSATPRISIGTVLPERTVHIRSFSKPYGPDLRLAVLAGAPDAVERARVYRTFGTGWTSRILQDAAAYLLTDASTQAVVDEARSIYQQRRRAVADPLAELGVPTQNADGLCLWVPVQDERHALVTLAAHGISASPGSRYHSSAGAPHIRVGTGRLTEQAAYVAESLALAAGPHVD